MKKLLVELKVIMICSIRNKNSKRGRAISNIDRSLPEVINKENYKIK